jgi:hypothetical protein
MIEMQTVVESTNTDPFAKVRKRKNKTQKKWGSGDFVEYEGVDKLVNGLEIPLLLQPAINPDQILAIDTDEYKGRYYRTQRVIHAGNNATFDEWSTDLEVDEYEDTGGDILAI